MRRFFAYMTLVCILCGCHRGGVRFGIECTGLSPEQLYYMTPNNDNGRYFLKGNADKNGRLRFRGILEQPLYVDICDGLGARVASLFVEQGDIRVAQQEGMMVASGTPSNDAYLEYQTATDSLLASYMSLREPGDSIIQVYENRLDSMGTALWQNNTDKILGVYLFTTEQIDALSAEQIAEWADRFTPEMRLHPYMEAVNRKLQEEQREE